MQLLPIKNMKLLVVFIFLFFLLKEEIFAQAGTLDNAFGNAGKISQYVGKGGGNNFPSIALQTDGKIVVGGSAKFSKYYDYFVMRFNINGTLDSGFGTGGLTSISVGKKNDLTGLHSLIIEQNGKIVLGGTTQFGLDGLSKNIFSAVRLKNNGRIDRSFGTSGKFHASFDSLTFFYFNAMAQQPDGKFVLAGGDNLGNFVIIRLTENGIVDSSFGNNGIKKNKPDSAQYKDDGAYAIAVRPNGKILVAGQIFSLEGQDTEDMGLICYNSNGSIDTTFGKKGITNIDFGAAESDYSILLQTNGKIVLAGDKRKGFFFTEATEDSFAVAQLDSAGMPDNTFGKKGKVIIPFNGFKSAAFDVKADQNNNLIIAGAEKNDSTFNFAITRLTKKGKIDSSFGTAGRVTTSFNNNEYAFNIAVQEDNKFIVCGSSGFSDDTVYYDIARYNNNTLLPISLLANETESNAALLTLYPNPVKDILSIKGLNATMNYGLKIINAEGNVAEAKTSKNINHRPKECNY